MKMEIVRIIEGFLSFVKIFNETDNPNNKDTIAPKIIYNPTVKAPIKLIK